MGGGDLYITRDVDSLALTVVTPTGEDLSATESAPGGSSSSTSTTAINDHHKDQRTPKVSPLAPGDFQGTFFKHRGKKRPY